jgi:hypothetical protein
VMKVNASEGLHLSNIELLYTIWGFQGGSHEECRLLRYKITVRTSQETHVSVTVPNLLMLYMFWSFYGGDCEKCRLVECDAVWLL